MSIPSKSSFAAIAAFVIFGFTVAPSFGESWRGVRDATGCTWARVKFVNNSSQVSNWIFGQCRVARNSTAASAVTDQSFDGDGAVDPGATRYVWVYGVLSGDVEIANADGGISAYRGAYTPSNTGDGELVVTVAEDGTVSAHLEAAAYTIPAHSGNFDPKY
jgi:hypothetical protein